MDDGHEQEDGNQDINDMPGVDRCIICGDVIPEGRHVCPRCLAGELEAIRDV